MLLRAPTGGFKEIFYSKQLYRCGWYHQHHRQFLQSGFPLLFPGPRAGAVAPRGRAGRLQHCHGVLLKRRLPPPQAPQGSPSPPPVQTILFSEHSLSIVYLCHLLFLPSLTFRAPVCLIFVFWGDFSPLLPPTCHFPRLPTGALKIFPVLSAFIVFSC